MPFEGYKVQKRDIQKKSQDNLSSKEDKRKQIRAVITDQFGNDSGPMVWDNELTRQLWVREVGTSSPSRVYCYNITPDQLGIGVIVGYETGSNMREVLRSDKEFYAPTNTTGASYESPGIIDLRAGGRTNLWIESKMIQPLSTYPDSTGLVVNVVSGDYPYAGARVTFPGQTGITLVQNPNVGEHYFAGLYLDSTNILNVIYGTSIAVASDPPEPAWPAGAFELSVVRINHTQTKIVLSIQTDPLNDIFDRRMLFGDENSTGVEVEDEGVDQGFANTLNFTGGSVAASVAAGLATINVKGWPFAHILSVSQTDPDADYSTIAAAITGGASGDALLLDSESYTGQNLTVNKSLTLFSGSQSAANVVGGGTDATVIDITSQPVTLKNFRVAGTNGSGAQFNVIRTNQNNTILDSLTVNFSTGSGTPTLGVGVYIKGGTGTGTLIKNCDVSVSKGTTKNAVLIDTAGAVVAIDGGTFSSANGDIVVNHASAVVSLNGPRLSNGGLIVTAGTVKGWYVDVNGNRITVPASGESGGVWRENTAGFNIKEADLATALTNAVDGDIIHIYPATITAAQTIADQVTVYGDGANQTILTQSTNTTNTVTVTDTNVTLRNLKVDNTGGGSSAAALVTDQAGFLADSCIFAKSAGAPTNGACVGVLGGDATFRNCDVSSSSGTDKYGYSISGGTVVLIGGSASGATFDLLISGATTVVELRGVKLLNSLIDVSGGALVKGWYLDANDKVIILNGSHVVMPSFPNGDLEVWQGPISFAAAADATMTADNARYDKVGAMVHTVSQSSDVPTVTQCGRLLNYSLLVDCTTVDSSIAAGDFCDIRMGLEGYDWVDYAQVGFPFSFWHKHTKTGTYCVAFRNSGADRSFICEYTQAVTDTWELATVFVLPSPTAGTWNYTNGSGIIATFALACGSTFQTTAGAWQTGNFLGTANQVNACDNTANNFRLALVGSVPDGDRRSKLARCQRYRYVLDAATSTNIGQGAKISTTKIQIEIPLKTTMRVGTQTLVSNITGYTGGSPGTTTIALVNYPANGFYTITGALTVAIINSNTDFVSFEFTAGTSWNGTAGDLSTLRIGPDVVLQLLASL